MQKIRAFIALEMPEEIRRALAAISSQLRRELEGIPLRWVPPENMHLTLKFLGDIEPERVPVITQNLETQARRLHAFSQELDGLGAFPNPNKARVLWVGLNVPESLKAFVQEMDLQLSKHGIPMEDRAFAPHLTLARVRDHARLPHLQKISQVLSRAAVPPSAATAERITLFRSELKPGGSVYNALWQFTLTDKD